MSSPIHEDGSYDRLKYAPPWARQQQPRCSNAGSGADANAAADETAATDGAPTPDAPEHPRDLDSAPAQNLQVAELPGLVPPGDQTSVQWLRTPARPFEGDRAVRELRARMTLDPQLVPAPPEPVSSRFPWRSLGRAMGMTLFAAGAAFVVVIFAFPEAKHLTPPRQEFAPPAVASTQKGDRAITPDAATAPARLVLIEQRRATMNEPVPLAVKLAAGVPGRGAVLISGLPDGTQLSTGAPIGSGTWRVPLADLATATVIPPRDFTGAMDITVALLDADAKVSDKNLMHIAWASAAGDDREPAPQSQHDRDAPSRRPSSAPLQRSDLRTLDRDEIEGLVKRGREYIANGDLAAARLVLRRAADGGDAQAALLLGTTFDPTTFERLKVIGAAPDPNEARNWYQRAIALGSTEAERRLKPLAEGTR